MSRGPRLGIVSCQPARAPDGIPQVNDCEGCHVGTIEAVKAVSDLYCPISGEVIAVNEALEEDPALVNSDPYGEGWMIRVRLTDPSELDDLLTPEAYAALIED